MHDEDVLRRIEWFMRRVFWSVHCRGCYSSFGEWDLDPNKLEDVLKGRCGYCGGELAGHYESGIL